MRTDVSLRAIDQIDAGVAMYEVLDAEVFPRCLNREFGT